jgi:ketol-acid reductoisomerase
MNSHPQPSNTNAKSPTSGARPRITIIGYGEGGGREHARRLRGRGHDVRVAMLPGGMSWAHAVADGFRPMSVRTATIDSDVLVLLVPPTELGGNVPRPTSSRVRVADDADPFPHPSMRVL